ncbi:MAG: response regulator transcription factor [Devosia sp.]
MSPSVLILDDDPDIRNVVRIAAERAGMVVHEAADGRSALEQLDRTHIDLVALDVGMPGMDGFACCKAIRARSSVPVIFLTAHDDEIDRVLGFELGADDYVTKPFSPRELVLRIKAILARGTPMRANELVYGDLHLDFNRHTATLGGVDLGLTVTEFAVLGILLGRPGFVIDRNAMIDTIYGGNTSLSGRTLDSHVRNIRAKAKALGYEDVVETVRGVGMRLGTCTA